MGKIVLVGALCLVAVGIPVATSAQGGVDYIAEHIRALLEEDLAGVDLSALIASPFYSDQDILGLGTYDFYAQNCAWDSPVAMVTPYDAYHHAIDAAYPNFTANLYLDKTCTWNVMDPMNCLGPETISGTLAIERIMFECDAALNGERLEILYSSVTLIDVDVDFPGIAFDLAPYVISYLVNDFVDDFESAMIDLVEQLVISGISDVDVVAGVPRAHLLPNHPNPFNPRTTIAFELPASRDVTLRVYDLEGRLVRTLLDGAPRAPGRHEATWNGLDEEHRSLPSGVYIYRLIAGEDADLGRMLLVK